VAKPGLGAPLPELTAEQIRTLKKLAAEVVAAQERRDRLTRMYFGRCNCDRGNCFFHTSYGARF
jgi:hypothetical protein